MNRINVESLRLAARHSVRSMRTRAAAAATTFALLPAIAMAQVDPAAAITSEVSIVKPGVAGIIGILAGVLGLLLLWAYIKRAK